MSSSDTAYLDFLNKANKDYSNNSTTTTTTTTTSNNNKILTLSGPPPQSIQTIIHQERCYISDADEPFEAVTLPLPGQDGSGENWPDNETFSKILDSIHQTPSGAIEILSIKEWDPKGQYNDIVEAIIKALGLEKNEEGGGGEVARVYKVPGIGSRVYYYVVGFDRKEGRLVGFRVLSVES